jgi:hypothetical protein
VAAAGGQNPDSSTSSVVTTTTTPVVITGEVIAQVVADTAIDKKGIVVDQATTEISCDETCIAALLQQADVPQGDVYVSVNGGARVKIADLKNSKIDIGSGAVKLDFTVVAPDGRETVVNLPVTRNDVSASESDSSSSKTMYLWILLVLLIIGLGVYFRSKNSRTTT